MNRDRRRCVSTPPGGMFSRFRTDSSTGLLIDLLKEYPHFETIPPGKGGANRVSHSACLVLIRVEVFDAHLIQGGGQLTFPFTLPDEEVEPSQPTEDPPVFRNLFIF